MKYISLVLVLMLNKAIATEIYSDISDPCIQRAFSTLQAIAFTRGIEYFAPIETRNSAGSLQALKACLEDPTVVLGKLIEFDGEESEAVSVVLVYKIIHTVIIEQNIEATILKYINDIAKLIVNNDVISVAVAYKVTGSLLGLELTYPRKTKQNYAEMVVMKLLEKTPNTDNKANGKAAYLAMENSSQTFNHILDNCIGTFVFPQLPTANFTGESLNKMLETAEFKNIWDRIDPASVSFACLEGLKYSDMERMFKKTGKLYTVIVYTLRSCAYIRAGITSLQIKQTYSAHLQANLMAKIRLTRELPLQQDNQVFTVEEVMCARTYISVPISSEQGETISTVNAWLQKIQQDLSGAANNIKGIGYYCLFPQKNVVHFAIVVILYENFLATYIASKRFKLSVNAMLSVNEYVSEENKVSEPGTEDGTSAKTNSKNSTSGTGTEPKSFLRKIFTRSGSLKSSKSASCRELKNPTDLKNSSENSRQSLTRSFDSSNPIIKTHSTGSSSEDVTLRSGKNKLESEKSLTKIPVSAEKPIVRKFSCWILQPEAILQFDNIVDLTELLMEIQKPRNSIGIKVVPIQNDNARADDPMKKDRFHLYISILENETSFQVINV